VLVSEVGRHISLFCIIQLRHPALVRVTHNNSKPTNQLGHPLRTLTTSSTMATMTSSKGSTRRGNETPYTEAKAKAKIKSLEFEKEEFARLLDITPDYFETMLAAEVRKLLRRGSTKVLTGADLTGKNGDVLCRTGEYPTSGNSTPRTSSTTSPTSSSRSRNASRTTSPRSALDTSARTRNSRISTTRTTTKPSAISSACSNPRLVASSPRRSCAPTRATFRPCLASQPLAIRLVSPAPTNAGIPLSPGCHATRRSRSRARTTTSS
jgi:hypothetical protein